MRSKLVLFLFFLVFILSNVRSVYASTASSDYAVGLNRLSGKEIYVMHLHPLHVCVRDA